MDSRRSRQQRSRRRQKYKRSRRRPSDGNGNEDKSAASSGGRQTDMETSRQSQGIRTLSDPSQNSWFWLNYHKVMDWQGRHNVAYWKSRAMALEHQNDLLLNYIENVNAECYIENVNAECYCHVGPEPVYSETRDEMDIADDALSEDNDGSLVFEVNEEMLSFFEQTIKHKQELKKQREDERKESEKCDLDAQRRGNMPINFSQLLGKHGVVENTVLYGKHASMIIAMETSMKLSFERYVDERKPNFWPNIPLKP